jgi:SAM-dependent methyltransferase
MNSNMSVQMNSNIGLQRCKICDKSAREVFSLPRNKKAGHPIPDEPSDCSYYQCESCEFLFTLARDADDQASIYDETYWANQDPDWSGRVCETLRLVLLSNSLLQKRPDQLEILDFGCGMGCFVDIARRSLQLKAWGTDLIRPKFGVDYFLPTLDGRRYDVVTACEVIEHLPDPMAMFRTIRSHLKSPGVFAFQTAQWDPSLGRSWWYLGPHNGHISLQSRGSLDYAARRLGVRDRRMWNDYPGVQAWLFK